jgi:hypothetical protein
MLYKKDQKLREKVDSEKWLLAKAKALWESIVETNKDLIEKIKDADWHKTLSSVEEDIKYDKSKVTTWAQQQKDKDRSAEWKLFVEKISKTIPDKKTLEDWAGKYKQRIINRWNNL